MSQPIKIGPLWDRAVFDPKGRVVKRRGRTLCRYDDVRQLRILEYINRDEEEQLLNANPDVQKAPRDAELWLDLSSGPSVRAAELDSAGRLLALAHEIAASGLAVPVVAERSLLAKSEPTSPRAA